MSMRFDEPNPARALQDLFESSGGWEMSVWSGPALVISRASLREMLRLVETEMGSRKMLGHSR